MKKILVLCGIAFLATVAVSCVHESHAIEEKEAILEAPTQTGFDYYWNQGKAELTSYKLSQARYGELHEGNAVLIFVTEPFSKSKLIKMDQPRNKPNDATSVLKLNFTRSFNTGIYPYSVMSSVFTPIDLKQHPNTFKITNSCQDWCGHSFGEIRLGKDKYQSHSISYFESEDREDKELKKVWLEDEIWARIRLQPEELPTGDFEMIIGSMYQRMSHSKLKEAKVKGTITAVSNTEFGAGELQKYTIEFPKYDRTLSIYFTRSFPYTIEGWEDTYKSGWGEDAKALTSKAIKNKRRNSAYWNEHKNEHTKLRKELGL